MVDTCVTCSRVGNYTWLVIAEYWWRCSNCSNSRAVFKSSLNLAVWGSNWNIRWAFFGGNNTLSTVCCAVTYFTKFRGLLSIGVSSLILLRIFRNIIPNICKPATITSIITIGWWTLNNLLVWKSNWSCSIFICKCSLCYCTCRKSIATSTWTLVFNRGTESSLVLNCTIVAPVDYVFINWCGRIWGRIWCRIWAINLPFRVGLRLVVIMVTFIIPLWCLLKVIRNNKGVKFSKFFVCHVRELVVTHLGCNIRSGIPLVKLRISSSKQGHAVVELF